MVLDSIDCRGMFLSPVVEVAYYFMSLNHSDSSTLFEPDGTLRLEAFSLSNIFGERIESTTVIREVHRVLNDLNAKLASHTGPRIAVFLSPKIESLLGFLAALSLGPQAQIAVINPAAFSRHINRELELFDPDLVLGCEADLCRHQAPQVFPESYIAKFAPEAAGNSERVHSYVRLFSSTRIVLYTSGSTGEPKTVRHTLASIVRAARNQASAMNLKPERRHFLATPPAHIIGLLTVLRASLYRGTLFLNDTESLDTFICQRLEALSIDYIHTVPTWYRAYVRECHQSGRSIPFRAILLSGEAVSKRDYIEGLRLLREDSRFIVGLGSSEVPTFCFYQVDRDHLPDTDIIPVGRSAMDRKIEIVDSLGQTLPDGEIGQVRISGPELGDGYLNEDRKQSSLGDSGIVGIIQSFLSADLGYLDSTGILNLIGRTDRVVKISGYRVELTEVEEILRGCPGVQDAHCCVRQVGATSCRLRAAYLIEDAAKRPEDSVLKSMLAQRLNIHSIPEILVPLTTFPRTVSGKKDFAKLDALLLDFQSEIDGKLSKSDPTVSLALQIWRKSLVNSDGGWNENFYDLGGDSLLATQMMLEMEQQLSVALPLALPLKHPILHELLTAIMALKCEAIPSHDKSIEASKIGPDFSSTPYFELTPGQRAIWLDYNRSGPGALYNLIADFEIEGPLNVALLEQALNQVVADNDVLRVGFENLEGEVRQRIYPEVQLKIDCLKAPDGEASQQDWIRSVIESRGRAAFDISTPPLMRAFLIQLGGHSSIFVCVFHHLLIDGNGFAYFYEQLETAYGARVEPGSRIIGSESIKPCSYRRNVWLVNQLIETKRKRAQAFWHQELQGAPLPLTASSAGSMPAGSNQFHGEDLWFEIGESTVCQIDQMASELQTTRFVILLAAFKVTWSLLNAVSDTITGCPFSGRTRPELFGALGCWVNTLPIRSIIEKRSNFLDVVEQLKNTFTSVFDLQDVPISELALSDQIEAGGFNHVFAYQSDRAGLRLADITARRSPRPYSTGTSKFEFSFLVFPAGEKIDVLIEFCSHAVSPQWVQQLFSTWHHCMRQALARPDLPIHRLQMYASKVSEDLVAYSGWGTALPSSNLVVPDLVLRHVGAKRSAIEGNGIELSYDELWQRSENVAQNLIDQGWQAGTRIAVLLEPSQDFIICCLGILRAACVYVPLEVERLSGQSGEALLCAEVSVILSKTKNFPFEMVTSFTLIEPDSLMQMLEVPHHLPLIAPNDPACLFLTSGSSGRPKPALIAHRGIVRLVDQPNFMCLDSQTRSLLHSSLGFDASTFEMWGPLANGGCVVVPGATRFSPYDMRRVVLQYRVNMLWMTAGLFHLIAESENEWLGDLNYLLAGGDVLSPRIVQSLKRKFPDLCLINGYGPTENTTFSTCHVISSEDGSGLESIPVGRPIQGTEVYVLNADGKLLPPGFIGEVCLGGNGLFLGYAGEQATKPSWQRPHPYEAQKSLYGTGDYGYWDSCGRLMFCGRQDRQIKLRGFRIDLDGLQHELDCLPEIVKSGVALHRMSETQSRLAAYVKVSQTYKGDDRALLESIKATLPSYKIPGLLVRVDEFPLTSNGKVDYRKLEEISPKFQEAAPAPALTYENELERRFVKVWQQGLPGHAVHPETDFFANGGDSLSALRLQIELEDVLQFPVPLNTIFRSPTPRLLATELMGQGILTNFRYLTRIREGTGTAKVVFMHTIYGNVFELLPIIHRLDPDISVYALQCDSEYLPTDSLTTLAKLYADELKQLDATENWLICGFSIGGILAHEVSAQLEANGCHLGRAIILDTFPFHLPPVLPLPLRLEIWIRRLKRKCSTYARLFHGEKPWTEFWQKSSELLSKRRLTALPVPNTASISKPRNLKRPLSFEESIIPHQMARHAQPTVFIHSEYRRIRTEVGWKYFAPNQKVARRCTSKHLSFLSENRETIIEVIEQEVSAVASRKPLKRDAFGC